MRRFVLLVEDHPESGQGMAELLEMWGYEVELVVTAREALEAVRRRPPAVALVDIGLPDIDGYELARRLRAECRAEPPLLVALTGHTGEEDARRARDAGFEHCLGKPVDLDALDHLLAEATGSAPL